MATDSGGRPGGNAWRTGRGAGWRRRGAVAVLLVGGLPGALLGALAGETAAVERPPGVGAAFEPAPGVEVVATAEAEINRGAVFGGGLFRRRVKVAAREVSAHLGGVRGRSCRAYFAERGVDLDAWLTLQGPPYIKEVTRTAAAGRRLGRELRGEAQAGTPFEWVFIAGPARSADACRLGSLLLHELGHLARRDVTDNEPPEFFSRCRLSACIDAGRFR